MKARRILTAVVLGLGCIAWTVAAAAAGNPHGAPPGQQKAKGSASAHGSAQANGKVSDRTHTMVHAHARAKAHGNASASGHGHAQVKVHGNASASAHGRVHGSVSAGAGVKPSSASSHWTVAAASSNQTKLYGNGSTAGQIAMGAGASGDTALYGPGNSQPHKVLCGTKMVDVHALKAHAGTCGGVQGSAFARMHGKARLFVHSTELRTGPSGHVSFSGSARSRLAGHAGVRGATATNAKPRSGGGVLGATSHLAGATTSRGAAVLASVRKGTLPFTGLALWLPAAIGLALLATGVGVRRKAARVS